MQTNSELIKPWIREILNDNSGGIKYTGLVAALTAKKHDLNMVGDLTLEDIDQAVSTMYPEVMVLEYTWHSMKRAKQFIYTP